MLIYSPAFLLRIEFISIINIVKKLPLICRILFIIIKKEIEQVECLLCINNIVTELFVLFNIYRFLTPSCFLKLNFWQSLRNQTQSPITLVFMVTTFSNSQKPSKTSQHPQKPSNP